MPKFIPNPAGIAALGRSPQMGAFLLAIGQAVAVKAAASAPYRLGNLSGSVDVSVEPEGPILRCRVEAMDFKAHWYEFGTSRHGPQPYLRPSLESTLAGTTVIT